MSEPISIVPFDGGLASGVAEICRTLGWPSYSDPVVAGRGCAAPGCTTVVALDASTGGAVGFAQVLGDGVVQALLAQVGVLPGWRRRGIARRMIEEAFATSGAQRLDLVTDDAQAFYRSFRHREMTGFRIYPDRPAGADAE